MRKRGGTRRWTVHILVYIKAAVDLRMHCRKKKFPSRCGRCLVASALQRCRTTHEFSLHVEVFDGRRWRLRAQWIETGVTWPTDNGSLARVRVAVEKESGVGGVCGEGAMAGRAELDLTLRLV